MLHHELFQTVGGFDESLPVCEDYDLWLRIAAKHPIGLIETPFIQKIGGHEDQLSHKLPAMDRFRIQSLVKILKSGILNPEQEKSAKGTLQQKAQIYIQGAIKRGHQAEVQRMIETIESVQTTKNISWASGQGLSAEPGNS